jgi:erythromycin esterase-like protein
MTTVARGSWTGFYLLLPLLPVLQSCSYESHESTIAAPIAKDHRPATRLPAESAGWTEITNNLVAAFDDVDIVALGETHGTKSDSDLRLRLIRAPAFSFKARSIVIEFANSLYQPILDRYVRGWRARSRFDRRAGTEPGRRHPVRGGTRASIAGLSIKSLRNEAFLRRRT